MLVCIERVRHALCGKPPNPSSGGETVGPQGHKNRKKQAGMVLHTQGGRIYLLGVFPEGPKETITLSFSRSHTCGDWGGRGERVLRGGKWAPFQRSGIQCPELLYTFIKGG